MLDLMVNCGEELTQIKNHWFLINDFFYRRPAPWKTAPCKTARTALTAKVMEKSTEMFWYNTTTK